MKLKYTMFCEDEDNFKLVAQISSYSEEGLLEESGKRKWTDTIKRYEDEQKSPIRENYEGDENPTISAIAYRSVKPDGDEETRNSL